MQFSRYSSSSVMVTVGEELLPLVPKAVRSHQGLMKPWYFSCNVSEDLASNFHKKWEVFKHEKCCAFFLFIDGN